MMKMPIVREQSYPIALPVMSEKVTADLTPAWADSPLSRNRSARSSLPTTTPSALISWQRATASAAANERPRIALERSELFFRWINDPHNPPRLGGGASGERRLARSGGRAQVPAGVPVRARDAAQRQRRRCPSPAERRAAHPSPRAGCAPPERLRGGVRVVATRVLGFRPVCGGTRGWSTLRVLR